MLGWGLGIRSSAGPKVPGPPGRCKWEGIGRRTLTSLGSKPCWCAPAERGGAAAGGGTRPGGVDRRVAVGAALRGVRTPLPPAAAPAGTVGQHSAARRGSGHELLPARATGGCTCMPCPAGLPSMDAPPPIPISGEPSGAAAVHRLLCRRPGRHGCRHLRHEPAEVRADGFVDNGRAPPASLTRRPPKLGGQPGSRGGWAFCWRRRAQRVRFGPSAWSRPVLGRDLRAHAAARHAAPRPAARWR